MQVSIAAEGQIDDDELAAVMAAISTITAEVKEGETQAENPVGQASCWLIASRMEATGNVKRRFVRPLSHGVRKRPWKTSSLAQMFLIVALCGLGSCLTLVTASASQALAEKYELPSGSVAVSDCPLPQAEENSGSRSEATFAPRDNTFIRVLLSAGQPALSITLPDGALLKERPSGAIIAELPPQSRWQISLQSPGGFTRLCFAGAIGNAASARMALAHRASPYKDVAFISGGQNWASSRSLPADLVSSLSPEFSLPIKSAASQTAASQLGCSTVLRDLELVAPGEEGLISVNGKSYRGSLLISTQLKGATLSLAAVNKVALEDYLLSVVPSEMPGSWPAEALKAQAIAARSYAVASLGKHESEGYDVKSTTEDQVYSGVSAETEPTNQAVADTCGLVLRHDGAVITAFFHSGAGGCTELAQNVWSKAVPYLQSVPDYDDDSPLFSWSRSVDIEKLEQSLKKSGLEAGRILHVFPVQQGASGRVRALFVAGSLKTIVVSGEEVRHILSLPSTLFNVGGAPGSYVFAGRGFGHGLGLSQWGARKLAASGYNAAQILSYYYREISIDQL